MIQLTRLNRKPLIVNSDLIEHIEVTPDTLLCLTSGQTFMVLETAEEVVDRVVTYRRSILQRLWTCPLVKTPDSESASVQTISKQYGE